LAQLSDARPDLRDLQAAASKKGILRCYTLPKVGDGMLGYARQNVGEIGHEGCAEFPAADGAVRPGPFRGDCGL
jgi:hypothetical protein